MEYQIIKHYGEYHQKIKTIEELNELISAILKDIDNRGDIENIKEEVADVEIMLRQLYIIYDLDIDDISKLKNQKLKRQKERMKNG